MADGTKYGDKSIEELINLMKEGNQKALQAFYSRRSAKFLFYAYDIVLDKHTAGTIVHDAFMRVWSLKENLRTIHDWEAMLYKICRDRAIDSNRSKYSKKNSVHLAEEIKEFTSEINESDTLANQINRVEIYNALLEAIDLLPERQKEVVKYLQLGKTTAQIGELMSISAITVRSLRQTAIRSIAEFMKAKGHLSVFLAGVFIVIELIIKSLRIL